MTWFAGAIFVSGIAQLIQTSLLPYDIYVLAPLIAFLFLASIVLCVHAVYRRLKVRTNWCLITFITVFAVLIISYYSYIEQNIAVRFITIAISTTVILFNNGVDFIKISHSHILEKLLKLCLVCSIFVVTLRAIILVDIINNQKALTDFPIIWAITQFLILFFTSLIFILLCACSIRDSMSKLEYERNIDPLTGLLNRRAFEEQLDVLEHNFSGVHALILCDIDHFKKINDLHGHHVGDLALKHVANILKKSVRKYDSVARFGGEEFILLLRGTSKDVALIVAERIRKSIESTPFHTDDQDIRMTLSFGVSFFENSDEIDTAMQVSDLLLYQAKKYGRNKIEWELQD